MPDETIPPRPPHPTAAAINPTPPTIAPAASEAKAEAALSDPRKSARIAAIAAVQRKASRSPGLLPRSR